jgi:ABC-type sugar transport system ATPase subunit
MHTVSYMMRRMSGGRFATPASPTRAPDAADPTVEASRSLIRVTNVAKSFGATRALRDASFELNPGEVHSLIGENGSGKSTLVKILSGVHAPDRGTIEFDGIEVAAPKNPREARRQGIATVFQEVLVAEARSVLDNVWLGVDGLFRISVPVSEKRARATEMLTELLGKPLDLDTIVEDLSLSDRQACSVVRALVRDPKVLILDEATSALDVATRDRLFEIVRRLTGRGVGVIFITHRLDEINELGDRVTVMRSGTTVGTLARGSWNSRELVHLMTGADGLVEHARQESKPRAERRGDVVISATALQLRPDRPAFDVSVRAGELVGVAGLEGHGQDLFLKALRGAGAFGGTVAAHRSGGSEVAVATPRQAAAEGIAFVPRERRQALFSWMSIRENFAMPTLKRDSRFGWLSLPATRRRFGDWAKRMELVFGRESDAITTLSGGNQQKVLVARWLDAGPRVLLLNDPTRGIDIGAKSDFYSLLAKLVDEGLAVVMLSSELDEHVDLMDRVLVFREHALFREIDRSSLSRAELVASFFGQASADRDEG